MADTYLFNSDDVDKARFSLKADTSTAVKTIEIRNAANATKRSIVLTPLLIDQLLSEWRRGEESVVTLDATPGAAVFVVFDGAGGSVWPNSEEADEDTGTDQVPLTTSETAIVMGWLKSYTAPP